MEASLWLALAAALGVAAFVQRHGPRQTGVDLAPRQQLGDFQVRAPAGWVGRHSTGGVVLEEPPGRSGAGRRLEIRCARATRFVSPLEYLVRSGDLRARDASVLTSQHAPGERRVPAAKKVTIAAYPGVSVSQTHVLRTINPPHAQLSKQTLACTILPDGRAVVLQLLGEGMADAADEDLVHRVGESLVLNEQPATRSGGELELPGGVHLAVPKGFRTFAAQDKFRTSKTMVAGERNGWLAVDVTPCFVLDDDRPAALLSMLMLRDPSFHSESVREVDQQTWVCHRRPEDLFPGVVYLRVNGDGRALLAEFRWDGPGPQRDAEQAGVESAWQQIAVSLRFSPGSDVSVLLHGGAAAVEQFPRDAGTLLPPSILAARWQWYDEAVPKTWWTTTQYALDAASIWAVHNTDRSPALGRAGRERSQWRVSRDRSRYDCILTRSGGDEPLSQESRLADGQLTTLVRRGSEVVAKWAGKVPEAYVPGALLPVLIGSLPFEPMILRTESALDPDGLACGTPLVLLLEPAFDAPRTLPGEKEGMRCWSVHVNGTSKSSRWYIDSEGILDSISFAGGLNFHRVEHAASTRVTEGG